MSKILILANFDVGLYKFRKDLIAKFLEQKHQVFISLPYGKLVEPLKKLGCQFIDTPIDRRGISLVTDGKLFFSYLSLLKKIQPDLVISYTIKPNIYGGLAARILKIPYAINITGLGTAFQKEGMVKKLVCMLYKSACKKAKTVFFENAGNRQTFLIHKLVKKKQTCLLNGAGINLEEYPYMKYPPNLTAGENEIRFLFIGRVMKEKGVDELFEAVRRIKKKYPNVVLELVGLYEDDYKEKVEQLEAKGILRFYGYQEDVKPYIARAHCFVLPSYHEGMANTLLEAGAMGRPLITSKIHGCMEAVEDGKNGYLVKVENVDDLERKMIQFIELDESEKEKFGRKSRKIMEERFEKEKVVDRTVARLEEVYD